MTSGLIATFHRQSVRRHRPECRDSYSSARSQEPADKTPVLALGMIALLFLVRGVAWWTGSVVLDRTSLIPAALFPLSALTVSEGILRRHAPRR